MKKQIDQMINGKFKYEQPPLLFSQEKLIISLKPGETVKGEVYLGTEENDRIEGYITSSSRRLVPGMNQFSGTTVRLPYEVDGVGLADGDVQTGWICITSSAGERKLPFEIRAEEEKNENSPAEISDVQALADCARNDFREAYRIFLGKSFRSLMEKAEPKQKALYAGLSAQPVTYQHLEEFLIGMEVKEPVHLTLETLQTEHYEVKESTRESVELRRSGWGHLRLEIETIGEFLEPERRVITDEDFIGSGCRVNYIIHADKLKKGNQRGRIIIRSPYQELICLVTASRDPGVSVDIHREEKSHRVEMIREYMDYREEKTDFNTWIVSSHYHLNQLRQSGCEYPEYQFYEAYLAHMEKKDSLAMEILRKYQDKEFTKDELELGGVYLYLCTLTGLYKNKEQAMRRLQNFYQQKQDSFLLFWLQVQLDQEAVGTPSMIVFEMEELFERGCKNPLLYLEACMLVGSDLTLLHRLSPFWRQVFGYMARRNLLTEELVMRLTHLSGYEKTFCGSLYHTLIRGYEMFPSDDVLEAICKYIMKDNPRRPEYFRWYSLAVEHGLRLTRLYEYYVETMDISYRRELPKTLLMYFAYNDSSLSDGRRAFVYACVIDGKEKEPGIYESYKEKMQNFAKRVIQDGRLSEDYAVIYQEFLFDPQNGEEAKAAAKVLFGYRLYCSDARMRQVIVRHSQRKTEEVYTLSQGTVFPRIYTEDAVILFQDEQQRRYHLTIPYNLKKLTDEEAAVMSVLEAGEEDFGVLLHYCEQHEPTEENLIYFQKLAKSPSCSDEYRNSVRRKILDFYAAHMQGQALEKSLEQLDLREYMQVDRKVLLETLIAGRMFRQAFALIEEYGYEGVDLTAILKLTSRMILKSNMAEDEEILALASDVYRAGKYDEVILRYLMLYRFGPVEELINIWKSAVGFDMDTYDLEERILKLLVFTLDYRKEGEAVLESYVKESGKQRVIGAYLTLVSYGIFVHEYPMSRFIRRRLETAYTEKWKLDKICALALLKDISKDKNQHRYEEMEKEILSLCGKEELIFGFFRKLPPQLLSPYQLDDKTFVECHAHPKANVTLYYTLDNGLGAGGEYRSEPMRMVYEGIFGKTFTLFYGETLKYYTCIEYDGKVKKSTERTVTMRRVEGTPGSKYQLLNQMLSARKLGKEKEVSAALKKYLRQEQYVREMFTIDKEDAE